ncbi:hypothetical protein Moror_877 [Moniliophthora roreri MCA 2997]|uniref:Mid2 domain-containing protein n=2 Tax=Moniliophthora roreri TaxID=221103 RepID=V2YDQ2_MONRO|nr:hypothetical protein Moror_877 [Moniliophthora roreri MCA 2997]KAI3606405.1 hypothetical protein WG66_009519 [Moniliophthora roreri]
MSTSFTLDSINSTSSSAISVTAVTSFAVATESIGDAITVTVAPTSLPTNPPPPRPPQPPLAENSGGKKANVGLIVGSIVVGVLLGILLAIGLWFCFCRRHRKANRDRKQITPMQGTTTPDYVSISDHAPPTYVSMQPRPIPTPSSSIANNARVARWLERINSQRSARSTGTQRKDTQDSETTSDSASMYSQSTYYSQSQNPFASTSTVVLMAPPAGYTGLPMVEEADERGDTGQGSRNSRVSR